jgi:hypothetical protein
MEERLAVAAMSVVVWAHGSQGFGTLLLLVLFGHFWLLTSGEHFLVFIVTPLFVLL